MTNARHRFTPKKGGRFPTVVAVALAIVGALLITLAACSSRSGPPQPTAAAFGSTGDTSAFSSAAPTSVSAVPTPPSSTAPSTKVTKSSAKPTKSSASTSTKVPVKTTTKSSTPSSTSSSSTAPTTTSSSSTQSTTKPSSTSAAPTTQVVPLPSNSALPPSFGNAAKGPILLPSPPVSLSVPAIGVKSALLTLGLNPDGTVQVPSLDDPDSKAGWYKNSPTPGSVGPAIILGHIDSRKYGPGVFYELGNLKPGDEIDVTRQDGSVAVFKVDGVRSYPKNNFPTAEVYGNIDHAGLRLITCGGTFDPSIRSYESNIVAFASLVSSH